MNCETRLNFEVLTLSQLRRVLQKCGKNYKGLNRRQMVALCNALIGQPHTPWRSTTSCKNMKTIKPAFEESLYFAKATYPVGNPWRTSWTTQAEAEDKAAKFCDDWHQLGVLAEASVFYRDGNAVKHFSSQP